MWYFLGGIFVFMIIGIIVSTVAEDSMKECEDMDKRGVPDTDPKKKLAARSWKIALGIGIGLVAIPILYVLGWLWYIFCGGFLLWMEDVWYMKIVYGFMSLIFLSILIGVIAIIFGGWKPYK